MFLIPPTASSLILKLRRLERKGTDLAAQQASMNAAFCAIVKQAFASEGASTLAGSWRALSKTYARRKAKTHPGRPINQRTGLLQRSLTDPKHRNHVFRVQRVGRGYSVEFGSNVPHLRGVIKHGRNPISITPAQQRMILQNALRTQIAASAGGHARAQRQTPGQSRARQMTLA